VKRKRSFVHTEREECEETERSVVEEAATKSESVVVDEEGLPASMSVG
jgi:hypothetical protein